MSNFDFKRFAATLKWQACMLRRQALLWTFVVADTVIIFEALLLTTSKNVEYDQLICELAQIFFGFFIIIMAASWSSIFHQANDKGRRQALLTLPVSNMEKYLSAIIISTVAWPLFVLLALTIGDSVRTVAAWMLFDKPLISVLPWFFKELEPNTLYPDGIWWPKFLFTLMAITWAHSLYTLGGTLIRKHPFVITSLLLIALIVGLAHVNSPVTRRHVALFSYYGYGGLERYVNPAAYVLMVVMAALATLNYRLSYKAFRNFQLFTNKWINYDIFKR